MSIYCGIDNGLNGGLVFLGSNGSIVMRYVMPIDSDGKKRRASALKLRAIFGGITCVGTDGILSVVVERPAGSKSVSAAVSMTDSYARIESVLQLGGFRYLPVTAKAWQRAFWTVPKMAKGESFDTKAAALSVARQLWPDEGWLASDRCRVPHDGMVDAALMAEYARRLRL